MVVVQDLHKHYGAVHAVNRVSFSVAEGEVFGLLGHNGAGKTTTIRIPTDQVRPSSGHALVAGYDPIHDREKMKPLINLVFDEQNLYERLTGRENLAFFSRLYSVPSSPVEELIDLVRLRDAAHRNVKSYSNGMKQRLLIARALINEPRVLFLDEPTRGLDPTSARDIHSLITHLSSQGTTVLLTTHYMEEADELCHRVAFLSEGRIVALDTPGELKLRLGQRTAVVLLENREEYRIKLDDAADADRLDTWMREGRVLSVHSEEGTLEDVFIALAGRPL
jgi:ABC-2 type transport system ATP-binding protein